MRTLSGAAGCIVAALCLTACEADSNLSGPNGSQREARPSLAVFPTRLIFRLYASDPRRDPAPQLLAVSNAGGGNLAWSARENATWLALGRSAGAAPGRVQVSLDRAGMHLGMSGYRPQVLTSTITFSSLGADNTPVRVPVTVFISYLPLTKPDPNGGSDPGCGRRCLR
jgi:hypothetical protein